MSRQIHIAQLSQTLKQTFKDWPETYTTWAPSHVLYITGSWHVDAITKLHLRWLSCYCTTTTPTAHYNKYLFWTQENKSTSERVCSLPSPPFAPTRPTSIRSNCWRRNIILRQGWQQGSGKGWRRGTQKGRKWCTGRGERSMWTALFFPMSFDEIANDSRHGKGWIKTIKNQTHLPATPLLPSPTRPTSISSNRGRLNATLWQSWLQSGGKGRRQLMGYCCGVDVITTRSRSRPSWPPRPRRILDERQLQRVSWNYWLVMARSISFWCAFIESCSLVR